MLAEYSIADIIVSNTPIKSYYIGRFETTEDPEIEWPHRHNFYSLVWFTEGIGTNVIDFEDYEIKKNRLFLTLPKQIHNWSYSKNTKGFVLIFERHFMKNFPVELESIVYFDLRLENTSFLKHLVENLMQECKIGGSTGKKLIHVGIHYLLLQLAKLPSMPRCGKKQDSDLITRLSCLVLDNISEKITVKICAKLLNISIEKLNLLCKENYGTSPKSFILDRKITEAKRLLYFTPLSVKEIAFRLGFEDSSYFSRIFKQKTNFSPSEFKGKCT